MPVYNHTTSQNNMKNNVLGWILWNKITIAV